MCSRIINFRKQYFISISELRVWHRCESRGYCSTASCVCERERQRVCVRERECVRKSVFVCVRECVCARESVCERERDRE